MLKLYMLLLNYPSAAHSTTHLLVALDLCDPEHVSGITLNYVALKVF
jgi:hypothetical protein